MKTATITIVGLSPYSQGRFADEPRLTDSKGRQVETADDHEKRTWRKRCHVNKAGFVFIPPMAFKNALSEAAAFLSLQIPGQGKSTYRKHIEAGVLVFEPLVLPVKVDDVPGEWLFVPADGKRGGGKRVKKCFPVIQDWGGDVTFQILDEVITEDVFRVHAETAGRLIGIGRFRPRNNGFYGRFDVTGLVWQ